MKQRAFSSPAVLALAVLTGACAAPSANTGVGSVPELTGGVPSSSPMVASEPAPSASTQWVMSCQPNQQAQIRNTVRDGIATTEVTCIDQIVRVARSEYIAPERLTNVSNRDDTVSLDDETYRPRRTVQTRPAVYTRADQEERVVRETQPKRSWQKSAVIIGSSAGAGAGLGAVMGGKKGALIGAAIGGGGAAVWDQITRRKD